MRLANAWATMLVASPAEAARARRSSSSGVMARPSVYSGGVRRSLPKSSNVPALGGYVVIRYKTFLEPRLARHLADMARKLERGLVPIIA